MQKPECVVSLSDADPFNEEKKFSPDIDNTVKLCSYSPSGSSDFTISSYDEPLKEEIKSEPSPEPVDNIPPSPFTLRNSNSKKYQRPSRANNMFFEPDENSSKTTEASAQDKLNSVLSTSGSNTASSAKIAAKTAGRGGGRVRDYTVLHPSCVSVCNVTMQDSIERSNDELVAPSTPADRAEAGQMKKKSDPVPQIRTR